MSFVPRAVLFTATLTFAACDKTPPAATPSAAHAPAAAPAASPTTAEPAAPVPSPHEMPAGHPPVGGGENGAPAMGPAGPMASAVPAEDRADRPLPLSGSGSVAELTARLAKIKDPSKHTPLEDAFRKVFTVRREQRDVRGAEAALTPLASDADPAVAALAERTLGYVRVSTGFDQEGAKARYLRAIELDADYGEAHYAMAFMLAMGDRAQGKVHFERAMVLGVPDTRGLRDQFYAP